MAQTYDAIASQTLTSNQTTVSFTSIASSWTDLILVINASPAGTAGYDIAVTFNSDTSSAYSRTYMLGNGSAASSGRSSSQTSWAPCGLYNNLNLIIQLNNYSNATTYKTMMARANIDSQYTAATVGLWRSTSAISRIDLNAVASPAWASGSTFALYGVKSA